MPVDTSMASTEEPAYFEVEEIARAQQGASFAETVTRQLFNTGEAASEIKSQAFANFVAGTQQQNKTSTLTGLKPSIKTSITTATIHNAKPPGVRMGTAHRGRQDSGNKQSDNLQWQQVRSRTSSRRQAAQQHGNTVTIFAGQQRLYRKDCWCSAGNKGCKYGSDPAETRRDKRKIGKKTTS